MATDAEVRALTTTLNQRARNLSSITTIGTEFRRAETALESVINEAARVYGTAIGTHGGAPPGVTGSVWTTFVDTINSAGRTLRQMQERERTARAAYESGERSVARGESAAQAGASYSQYAPPRSTTRTTTPTPQPVTPSPTAEAAALPGGSTKTAATTMQRAVAWLNPPGYPVYRRPWFIGAALALTAGLGVAAYRSSQQE